MRVSESEAKAAAVVVDRSSTVALLLPPPPPPPPPSEAAPPSRAARPSGGKDRHSKVNTAKGPRDRRVRLSVPTAVQFYDVQDRLGFDQPSKAVEWLIRKAKPAIDELAQLPSQGAGPGGGEASEETPSPQQHQQHQHQQQQHQLQQMPHVSSYVPGTFSAAALSNVLTTSSLDSSSTSYGNLGQSSTLLIGTYAQSGGRELGFGSYPFGQGSTHYQRHGGTGSSSEDVVFRGGGSGGGGVGGGNSAGELGRIEQRAKARERARERAKEKHSSTGVEGILPLAAGIHHHHHLPSSVNLPSKVTSALQHPFQAVPSSFPGAIISHPLHHHHHHHQHHHPPSPSPSPSPSPYHVSPGYFQEQAFVSTSFGGGQSFPPPPFAQQQDPPLPPQFEIPQRAPSSSSSYYLLEHPQIVSEGIRFPPPPPTPTQSLRPYPLSNVNLPHQSLYSNYPSQMFFPATSSSPASPSSLLPPMMREYRPPPTTSTVFPPSQLYMRPSHEHGMQSMQPGQNPAYFHAPGSRIHEGFDEFEEFKPPDV